MKRWEAWWNHAALAAVSLTGVAYGLVKYFFAGADADSRVGSPWQPLLLKAHILVAPFVILGVGLLLRRHALARIASGEVNGRRSGVAMLWIFAPLALTGYLIQALVERGAVRATGFAHAGLGVIFLLGYALHPKRKASTDTGADEGSNGAWQGRQD
jgi:hypothetical protein